MPPVRLFAPEGATEINHHGTTYTVGEDGTVEVPHEVAELVQVHGYSAKAPATEENGPLGADQAPVGTSTPAKAPAWLQGAKGKGKASAQATA